MVKAANDLQSCPGCRKLLESHRDGAEKDAEHSAILDNINASLKYLRADHKELLGVLFRKVEKQGSRITQLAEKQGERITAMDRKIAAWGGGLAVFVVVVQIIGWSLQLWLTTRGLHG